MRGARARADVLEDARQDRADEAYLRTMTDGQLRDMWADQSACPDSQRGAVWVPMIRIEMGRRGLPCE